MMHLEEYKDCPVATGCSPGHFLGRESGGLLGQVELGSVFDEVGQVALFVNRPDLQGFLECGFHPNGEVFAG